MGHAMMVERFPDGRWKFDRTLSLGDLVSVVTAAVMVVASYFALSERLALVEQRTNQATETNTKQDVRLEALLTQIDAKLERLDDKLDRKIDK